MKIKNKLILLSLVLIFSVINKIDAKEICEKPIEYEFTWCQIKDKNVCYTTTDREPGEGYFLSSVQQLECEDGWSKVSGKCKKDDCSTNNIPPDNFSEPVLLNESNEKTENQGDCAVEGSKDLSASHSLAVSATHTSPSWCPPAYVTGDCVYTLTANSWYKFSFKDEEGTKIRSLINKNKGTQYAPGTGVEFEVDYTSGITYSVSTSSPQEVYYTGYTRTFSCEPCPPPDDDEDDSRGWDERGEVPRSCAGTAAYCTSCGGCGGTYTCYYCEQHVVGYSCPAPSVSVSASTNIDSDVAVTTETLKGENTQQLGPLVNNGTTQYSQSFKFNVPPAFINVKTGQILYKGINYNGQNTDLWKPVTNGYYIPSDAIPKTISVANAQLEGIGYTVSLNGVTRQSYVIGDLSCTFDSKIPGCPVEPCEPTDTKNCNPKTDQYKCCRNADYLKDNKGYYEKECAANGYDYSFLYRQISLNNPFPNRDAGLNWYNWINEKDNQERLENSYENLEYSVSLTPSLIQKIREYNEKSGNEYTSWTQMNDDGSSQFLKDTNEVSMQVTKSADVEYYKLGCGPSNEDMEWCK